MAVLVTGASGFLGGRLAEMLCARGEEVLVLARQKSDLQHLAGTQLRVVRGSLADEAILREAVKSVSAIYHCAACSTDWAPWKTYYEANVAGTRRLVAAAFEARRLERFVHVSTTDIYGYPLVPCSEEASAVDAGLPYNQTKGAGELAVWEAHRQHRLPVTIIRPATIYGPRGKDFTVEIATLLRQRMMATVDRGTARAGFTYVDNVAKAIMDACGSAKALGQAYNIADGTNATWAEYLGLFAAELGVRRPWIDLSLATAMRIATVLETPHRMLSLRGRPLLTRHAVLLLGRDQEFPNGKAVREIGFSPAVALEEGIRRSVEWLRETGWAA